MPHRHHVVLHDWHRYHLRRPPVGYRWVSPSGGAFLCATSEPLPCRVISMVRNTRIALSEGRQFPVFPTRRLE
jgi:hypothetical protein